MVKTFTVLSGGEKRVYKGFHCVSCGNLPLDCNTFASFSHDREGRLWAIYDRCGLAELKRYFKEEDIFSGAVGEIPRFTVLKVIARDTVN